MGKYRSKNFFHKLIKFLTYLKFNTNGLMYREESDHTIRIIAVENTGNEYYHVTLYGFLEKIMPWAGTYYPDWSIYYRLTEDEQNEFEEKHFKNPAGAMLYLKLE